MFHGKDDSIKTTRFCLIKGEIKILLTIKGEIKILLRKISIFR
jgi:hypothetical protein